MGYYFPSLEIDVVCFRGFGGVRVSDRGVYVDFHAACLGWWWWWWWRLMVVMMMMMV